MILHVMDRNGNHCLGKLGELSRSLGDLVRILRVLQPESVWNYCERRHEDEGLSKLVQVQKA